MSCCCKPKEARFLNVTQVNLPEANEPRKHTVLIMFVVMCLCSRRGADIQNFPTETVESVSLRSLSQANYMSLLCILKST